MLTDLQLCGAKPRTQESYLREAENLARYFNRSPAELGEAELKEYLLYLIKERHLSEGTFRYYVAGLKFLYRTTLKREWPVEKIKHPRAKSKLPVVLDLSEVESLFSVTKNLKHKVMLMLTYSAGLRVSEAARLKLTDIDSKRMTVRISQGKGGKDRYSILSRTTLEHLRLYWKKYRPQEWLFEGQKQDEHISLSTILSADFKFEGGKASFCTLNVREVMVCPSVCVTKWIQCLCGEAICACLRCRCPQEN
jgi:site-specific recombinase XerD